MEETKNAIGNKGNSSSNEQEEKKTVELPALDFFKINILSFIVPLYICLGLFLLFEYFFIITFSIPLIYHLLLLPGVFLLLYYIYLMILIEFAAIWARRWHKKSPPKEGVFQRFLGDVNSEEGRKIKYYHKFCN